MVTFADTLAALLVAHAMSETGTKWKEYGPFTVDSGHLGILHDAYDTTLLVNGRKKPNRWMHGTQRYAVLNALRNTKRGQELFEKSQCINVYPGIANGRIDRFTLKPEFRDESLLDVLPDEILQQYSEGYPFC